MNTFEVNWKQSAKMLLSEPGNLNFDNLYLNRRSNMTNVTVATDFEYCNKNRRFRSQYAFSYLIRFKALKPKLIERVRKEWPDVTLKKVRELCDFTHSGKKLGSTSGSRQSKGIESKNENLGQMQHIAFRQNISVAIIGTILKHQPEKPSVLREIAADEDNLITPSSAKIDFTSLLDSIELEDETGRVQLVSSVSSGMTAANIVNGVVCALKGKATSDGKFEITDVLFPTPKPAQPLRAVGLQNEMVFVSGLELGLTDGLHELKTDMLFDLLEGLVGSPGETETYIQNRTSVFFIGNTIMKFAEDDANDSSSNERKANIMQRLDLMLSDLSKTMDVFIIPGENDPTEPMLPQPPFHRCALPLSFQKETFKGMTNPARLTIPLSSGNKAPMLDVLLTSGENVMDALRNSNTSSPVEMAKTILKWGHLCPTAPDTLPLHPGVNEDAFVLDSLPNLFVVGNQQTFQHTEWLTTKIITIPKFSKTGMIVILKQNMEVMPLMVYA